MPIAFTIKFDPSVIRAKTTYVLQARITVDNRLMFIGDERYEVDPLAGEPHRLTLKMAAANGG